jgi:hypothetical protein
MGLGQRGWEPSARSARPHSLHARDRRPGDGAPVAGTAGRGGGNRRVARWRWQACLHLAYTLLTLKGVFLAQFAALQRASEHWWKFRHPDLVGK